MHLLLPIFAGVISSVAELRQAVWSDIHVGDTFSITCTVTAVTAINRSYWVKDDTGYGYMRSSDYYAVVTNLALPKAGSRIRVTGHIGIDPYNWQRAFTDSFDTIGTGDVPPPVSITAEQLNDESLDDHAVVMRGIVADVVKDEIDFNWRFLIFRSDHGSFLAALGAHPDESPEQLVGATVSAKGIAKVLPDGGRRKFKTAHLTIADMADITIERPAPADPFSSARIPSAAKGVENFQYQSASLISRMGYRSAEGVVIAVFNGGKTILVKTPHGKLIGAELKNDSPPSYGEHVAIAGFPETDFFILKLSGAMFKRQANDATADDVVLPLPETFDMDKVLRDMLGRTIQVSGTAIPSDSLRSDGSGHFSVACGTHRISVDTSALGDKVPPPDTGSTLKVVGVCVFNSQNWSPGVIFPRTNGFTLVPRASADICVLSRPPWWTVRKLAIVIAVLIAALLAILLWNHILRHMIERRGRQLFKAEVAKVESELRTDERTRLAMDLHDSIAQTLTGVSFQIDAAEKTLRGNPSAAMSFLNVARKTLLSCREELRRCLWDLRSQALEERNFQDAIRKTIQPHAGEAEVSIQFNVLRTQMSDTTAHNILSMIRELCVNAVRHGHARHIWIVGENRDGVLRFSVRDDGVGFDPAARPGPAQGHFGLQGIKERTGKLHATMKIESVPGKGTKITIESGK